MELCNIKPQAYIGIDVSQETLDIYWQEKSYKIQNQADDISAFIKAEISCPHTVLCVLESTGGCERIAVQTFTHYGIKVHVAHPSRVHAFAKACGHFAKTDKLDAILLYKYALFIGPNAQNSKQLDRSHQEIIALRRLVASIERNLHRAQCQLKRMSSSCSSYLQEAIVLYKKQLAHIQQQIDLMIDNHAELSRKRALMITLKGMGSKTASILLAELPELGSLSRAKIPSLLGVVPKTYQSGKKSLPGHITGGRFFARKSIYMVALVASRHNPSLKQKYLALIHRGKPKKVALVAIMRHIIIILNSMLKNSLPYALSS